MPFLYFLVSHHITNNKKLIHKKKRKPSVNFTNAWTKWDVILFFQDIKRKILSIRSLYISHFELGIICKEQVQVSWTIYTREVIGMLQNSSICLAKLHILRTKWEKKRNGVLFLDETLLHSILLGTFITQKAEGGSLGT